MKVSELIQELRWIAEGKDDCEVVVRDIANRISYDVCSISFHSDDHRIRIEVSK